MVGDCQQEGKPSVQYDNDLRDLSLSRRRVLQGAAFLSMSAGMSALLAACGGDDDDDEETPASSADEPTATAAAEAEPTEEPEEEATEEGTGDDEPTEGEEDATEEEPSTEPTEEMSEEPTEEPAEEPATEGQPGGTFSLPVIDNPQMWPVVGGLPNILVNKVLYSTLIKFDDPDQLPVGDLAETWEASADGMTWTFSLKQNATWHDGEALNADDVVFTVNEVWMNPDVSYYLRGNLAMIDTAEKIDDFTAQLNLIEAAYNLPWMLGYLADILPEHIMADWTPDQFTAPTEFLQNPIGSGPYRFDEAQPGSHARFVRYDDFYDGAPLLDAVLFKVIPDIEQQLAQLQTGELDLVIVEPHQLEAVENNPDIRINEARQVNYTYIAFHNGMEPFTDPQVRIALTHAIDRQSILDNAQLGRGILANHPISPFLEWAYNDEVEGFAYDPELANQMLEEAGWVMGSNGVREKDGQPLRIVLEVDAGNPVREQTAIFGQQYWQDVGADVELRTSPFNDLLARIRAGDEADVQSFVLWYITPPHPDITAYFGCDQSTNTFHYCNPEVDRILVEARATADLDQQAEMYKEMSAIIAEDAPIVFLYYPYELQVLRANVQSWPSLGYRDALAHITKVWKE